MTTKVLVFESDAAFAAELRSELSRLNCVVTIVDDGNQGLQAAAADPPDLVLLSIELPRMNGFSVCNKLKKDPALKDVPLIIMSSESSEETFEQHRKLRTRAEHYVHKPIAFGELLQHIRACVPIEMPLDDASLVDIVIDDEGDGLASVEMGSEEVEDEATMMFARPDLMAPAARPSRASTPAAAKPKRVSVPPPAPAAVDADVDAFIEGGFGRMTSPAEDVATAPQDAPAATRKRQSLPPAAVDTARTQELERQLSEARLEATALRADFDTRVEADQQKFQSELESLRAKLNVPGQPAAAGAAGVSSREFLNLRETVNKKDKELLALKETLSKKDREVFEARDKTLELERAKTDADDRALATDRALEDTREKLEIVTQDKALARKSLDETRERLAKTQGEAKNAHDAIEEGKVREKETQKAHEAAMATLAKEHEITHQRERDEARVTLEQHDAAHHAAVEEASRQHAGALAEAASRAALDKQSAVAAAEGELKAANDARLGALYRGQQDDLGKLHAEHTRQVEQGDAAHAAALASANAAYEKRSEIARADAELALAERESSLEATRAAEVSAVEQERDARIATLEQERDARIATLEQERDARIATLEGGLATAHAELGDVRERKAAGDATNEARVADLAERLAAVTLARDDLDASLATSRARAEQFETENDSLVADLIDTKAKLGIEAARAQKAYDKWESDKTSLDRAKSALALALAQIDETESRSIS